MSCAAALIVAGIVLEGFGLLLISAEDFGVVHAPEFLRRARRRLDDAARRVLGMPVVARGSVSVSDSLALRPPEPYARELKEGADADQTRLFLLAEVRKAHDRINEVEYGLEAERVRRVNRLNELRQEVDAAIGAGVEMSRVRFVRLRRIGIAFLFVGSALLAVANIVA